MTLVGPSLLPNRLDAVLHVLACIRAGVVATPLNYRYRSTEIERALRVSGARMLLFHAERQADVAGCGEPASLDLGCLGIEEGADGHLADQIRAVRGGGNPAAAGAAAPAAAAE